MEHYDDRKTFISAWDCRESLYWLQRAFLFSKSPPQVKFFYDPFREDEVLKMEKIAIIQISTRIQYDFQITAALLITQHFWYLKICLLILTNQFFLYQSAEASDISERKNLKHWGFFFALFSLDELGTRSNFCCFYACGEFSSLFLFFSTSCDKPLLFLLGEIAMFTKYCRERGELLPRHRICFYVVAGGRVWIERFEFIFFDEMSEFYWFMCRFCFWHRNFFFKKLPVFKVDILKVEELSEANRLHWNIFFCQSMIFRLALWYISYKVWIRFPGL